MSTPNIFIPSTQVAEQEATPQSAPNSVLKIKHILTLITQSLVVISVGLLPVLFLVGNDNTLSFDRLALATAIGGVTVVLAAILVLFQKRINTILPMALGFFGLFVLWGLVAGIAQGDTYDSLWGRTIEPMTVVFVLVMLVFTALPLLLQSSTKMLIRALALLQGVALIVLAHTLLWYWFGFSWLGFGELSTMSQSLLGGFNDSAIYAGLIVLFGLTTLVMLPLRAYAQIAVSVILFLALALLLLVNFSMVWYAVLLVSAVTTGYVFLRRYLFQNVAVPPISGITKLISSVTFIIALLAVLFGANIAQNLSQYANTQFVEVRPSFEASVAIMRAVYEDDLMLGVGPNRFEDAWRQHKNEDVNASVFWNTDFQTGYSFMTTVFTTYGLVGGALLILFQLSFLWFGLTRLLNHANDNVVLRYVVTTVFIGALFLWAITYVYSPGVTILLLTASLTGLALAATSALDGSKQITIDVITNRIRGFVALFLVLLLIAGTVAVMCGVFKKYSEQANVLAVESSKNDEVVGQLANQRITELQQLIATANPDSVTQDDLLETSRRALTTSREAISLDPTNPVHHQRLATLYGLLGAIGVDGAYESALSTLDTVKELDPKNPTHHLATARVLLADDDVEGAMRALDEAINLKFNYTAAIQLQTNIAIANNDTAETIERVRNIAQLEPGNPTRWYQLGLLYAASDNTEEAVPALLRAIRLDPTYADARYILALQYLEQDRDEEALRQLRRVRETNPGNTQLSALIGSVERGEEIDISPEPPTFNTNEPAVDNESGISVPSGVSTDLFSPVNEGEPVNGS